MPTYIKPIIEKLTSTDITRVGVHSSGSFPAAVKTFKVASNNIAPGRFVAQGTQYGDIESLTNQNTAIIGFVILDPANNVNQKGFYDIGTMVSVVTNTFGYVTVEAATVINGTPNNELAISLDVINGIQSGAIGEFQSTPGQDWINASNIIKIMETSGIRGNLNIQPGEPVKIAITDRDFGIPTNELLYKGDDLTYNGEALTYGTPTSI